jgi:hypothetical protein
MESEGRRRSEVSFPARDAGYTTADGVLHSVDRRRRAERAEDTMSKHELQRQIEALEIELSVMQMRPISELRRELVAEFSEADADVGRAVDGASGDRARYSTVSRPVEHRSTGSRVADVNKDQSPLRRTSSTVRRSVSDVASRASASLLKENSRRSSGDTTSGGDVVDDGNRTVDGGASRRVTPTIKLGSYDGTTALETFLAKLKNCAEYYNWDERDRLCHLKASLEGHAGQVLWEIGQDATESEVIKLLHNRFGNVYQM